MPGTATVLTAAQVRDRLIDDTEATNWQAAAVQSGDSWNTDTRFVTVDLAGTAPQRISRAQVSAQLGLVWDPLARGDQTQNRFTALRSFELWSCNARFGDCMDGSGFNRIYTSAGGRLPRGRPAAGGAGAAPAGVHVLAGAGHAPPAPRPAEPVPERPRVPGRAGRRPAQRDRLQHRRPDATKFVRAAELQAFGQPSQVQVTTG